MSLRATSITAILHSSDLVRKIPISGLLDIIQNTISCGFVGYTISSVSAGLTFGADIPTYEPCNGDITTCQYVQIDASVPTGNYAFTLNTLTNLKVGASLRVFSHIITVKIQNCATTPTLVTPATYPAPFVFT
jgi:hypothetical protein